MKTQETSEPNVIVYLIPDVAYVEVVSPDSHFATLKAKNVLVCEHLTQLVKTHDSNEDVTIERKIFRQQLHPIPLEDCDVEWLVWSDYENCEMVYAEIPQSLVPQELIELISTIQ